MSFARTLEHGRAPPLPVAPQEGIDSAFVSRSPPPIPEFPGCFPHTLFSGGKNSDSGVQEPSAQIPDLVQTRRP